MNALVAVFECVCAIVAGGVVVVEVRTPYGPIDPVYEALRTQVTGRVRL